MDGLSQLSHMNVALLSASMLYFLRYRLALFSAAFWIWAFFALAAPRNVAYFHLTLSSANVSQVLTFKWGVFISLLQTSLIRRRGQPVGRVPTASSPYSTSWSILPFSILLTLPNQLMRLCSLHLFFGVIHIWSRRHTIEYPLFFWSHHVLKEISFCFCFAQVSRFHTQAPYTVIFISARSLSFSQTRLLGRVIAPAAFPIRLLWSVFSLTVLLTVVPREVNLSTVFRLCCSIEITGSNETPCPSTSVLVLLIVRLNWIQETGSSFIIFRSSDSECKTSAASSA